MAAVVAAVGTERLFQAQAADAETEARLQMAASSHEGRVVPDFTLRRSFQIGVQVPGKALFSGSRSPQDLVFRIVEWWPAQPEAAL